MKKTKEKIRVGFLTSTDPLDRRSSSGVHYRMYNALCQEFDEVIPLGPATIKKPVLWVLKLLGFIHLRIFGGEYNPWHSILLAKHYGRQFNKKLKGMDLDVIYAPKAATSVTYIQSKLPICYSGDAFFNQLTDYYDRYSNFSKLSIKESLYIEKTAMNNSKFFLFASQWAVDYAIKNKYATSDRVFLVKHGANINQIPDKSLLTRDYTKTINLLFVGIEWKRKGGDIAFEAFKLLLDKGCDVTLTICGCTPPVTHPRMKVIPFLNKNIPEERAEFEDLYYKSHIFFMPTRAECLGIANCEACAFGLPVISTNTGGVPSAVEHNYNGIILPLEAGGKEYAAEIEKLMNTPSLLLQMSKNARKKFEEELNWPVWAKRTKEVILKSLD